MEIDLFRADQTESVVALFAQVFAVSEGEAEGRQIGCLVREMIDTTGADDLIGCVAKRDGNICGGIFLSRVAMPDARTAFILSPVAVATELQGQGAGQALIHYGIDLLKARGVALLLVYGDPAYYCKTGFQPLSENTIAAPFPLSYPHGWQGQSLNGADIVAAEGAIRCVPALSRADYW